MKQSQGQGHVSNSNFCCRHVREPCRSFGRRCSMLVKEQRARFYILRRCVTMLLCWHERGDL
ncbi:hypothetical protein PRUPE_2G209600 [Prunus persica]|uniref:DEVIL-like protein n=1 Tax=Prunus persica TaxID=3760 RepID=A0A251QJ49_PRUPE|nr:hypothetical protein GBA52_007130 [Prunus armeniaca]ONI23808.1 hypothetical protein PRUPE_2G209600 [Prunus persica]